MIKKREYNPELSVFSNLVLDLTDFKDRVRPLAKDMSLVDAQRGYQKKSVEELEQNMKDIKEVVEEVTSGLEQELLEERREQIEAPKGEEK